MGFEYMLKIIIVCYTSTQTIVSKPVTVVLMINVYNIVTVLYFSSLPGNFLLVYIIKCNIFVYVLCLFDRLDTCQRFCLIYY